MTRRRRAPRFAATPRGRRYHRPYCVDIDQYGAPTGARPVSDQQVYDRGLTPCKNCRPEPTLAVVRAA